MLLHSKEIRPMTTSPLPKQMPLVESLEVLLSLRTDEVVVTAMGTAREWMALGSHPLDFVFVPSSMGQATALGLGLALAQPQRKVVVCNGDGSMLMNLGSLVTITAAAPENLIVLVFDNGVYEVTGSQLTPGSAARRPDGRDIDFAALARACGFRNVLTYDVLDDWRNAAAQVLSAAGPTFALLKVAPIPGAVGPRSPGPGKPRAKEFAAALAGRDR
jgi:sulfopyruvate decarboxylase subunit beta